MQDAEKSNVVQISDSPTGAEARRVCPSEARQSFSGLEG
jgi:hypothetical protein